MINLLTHNRTFRAQLAAQSHQWFFNLYLSHYVTYEAPPFQKDLFTLTEDESIKKAVVVAFRGSAKSTICTLSYPLWGILGKQQKKFIVIVGLTQRQAKQHLINIKMELENNELLKRDLGPFREDDLWGAYSLIIPKFDARISAVSMEQSIRGSRHRQHRPDLIICDDVEDLMSVKTQEGRDKIYNWITGEIIPAGDQSTRYIFIGNLLHEDGLLMRLKNKISKGAMDGVCKMIPLIDGNNAITWPGKFPNQQSIDAEQKNVGNQVAWLREMMLKIVPDEGQIIYPEWIKSYHAIIEPADKLRYIITGVDPAISTKNHADYTAAVSAKVYGYGDELKIYILPNPINKRMNFPESLKTFKQLSHVLNTRLLIESNAFQKSLAEQLVHEGIPAEEVINTVNDKRARLNMVSHLVKDGKVLFPDSGAEALINQIIGFGVEKHDDLVDAFTMLVLKVIEEDKKPVMPEVLLL